MRDGLLHILVTMRSSDIWLGLPYDCFNFCNLLHLVANMVGVNPGSYKITMGSLHQYANDEMNVKTVLDYMLRRDCSYYEWDISSTLVEWVTTGPRGDDLSPKRLRDAVDRIFHETFLQELSHASSID